MKFNFKVNKRNLSGLLALVMILSVFLMPVNVLAAEKKEPFHSTKKEDSYVQVVKEGDIVDEQYSTTLVYGNNGADSEGNVYPDVLRGNVYLEMGDNSGDLSSVQVKLIASKGEKLTVLNNTQTVINPEDGAVEVTLNLNEDTKILVGDTSVGINEWSYTITGGKSSDTVNVEIKFDVSQTLKGTPKNPESEAAAKALMKVPTMNYSVKKGTTAAELSKKYARDNELTMNGVDYNYVDAIGAYGAPLLKAFGYGSMSGWMYKVKDSPDGPYYFPNVGIGGKSFTSDGGMTWHYTIDYTAENWNY